ncbi:class I SAM-dependent methyltransferase [Variovorax sp. GT1P44]|uniref:class I SAM-dependent methyltransferase n=1 Tax=Variovorax sp. GT1P44 TaxID=3443742 RepID=UPI003F451886
MKDKSSPEIHPKVMRLVTRFRNGNLSGQMTLMYWLKLGRTVEEIEAELATLTLQSSADDALHFAELGAMLALHREGCVRIASMVGSGVDTEQPARTIDEGLAFCKRLFDWSSQQSSEASVALYSLGSPTLLAAATDEIVVWLRQQGLLDHESDGLEIGCGIGRFEEALAPALRSITGVDLSPEMVARAQSRCQGLPNVSVRLSDGRDLAAFDDASFDLVLAVDSFPYLFQSGRALLARHFEESRRVLRPGGALAVFELSYGRSLEADRSDFAKLAAESMLDVVVAGEQPFHGWDGIAFLARR